MIRQILTLLVIGLTAGQMYAQRCGTCLDLDKYRLSPRVVEAVRTAPADARPVTIDHLIVFDASGERYAVERYGSADALARLAVQTLNEAMRNSDVAMTFRLAGVMILPREMRSIDEGQDFVLQDPGVKQRRRELRADVVTLCVQNIGDGTTGVATQEAKRDVAYSTVMASEVAGYVVAHEVAHIFGCQHSLSPDRADKGQHAYAVGVERAPYYTIMGFPSNSLNAHELAPVFSGVQTVWRGVRLGSPTQDNVRMLRERMAEVSTFGDYLEPRYYVDRSDYYAGNQGGVVRVGVRTGEFFAVEVSAPGWISVSPTYALDDVTLSVTLQPNHSGAPRSGRITLSGTEGYAPVTITIHQGVDDPQSLALEAVTPIRPSLVLRSGALMLEGADVDRVELYDMSGVRIVSASRLAVGVRVIGGLPSGSYICRLISGGQEWVQRLAL